MDIVKKIILGLLIGLFVVMIVIAVDLKTKEQKKISSKKIQNEIESKLTEAMQNVSNNMEEKNIDNSETKAYEIEENKNKTFYLHKSKLEIPNSMKCYAAKDKALNGMNTNDVTKLQIVISNNQQYIEYELGEMVSLLKDKDSKYWDAETSTKIFIDPVSGEKVKNDYNLIGILRNIKEIIEIIKDEDTKKGLQFFCDTLQEGLDNHDIARCFEAHEILHDYNYWVINYPVVNLPAAPYDWSGLKTYFGRVEL